jgi:hypothetical protein
LKLLLLFFLAVIGVNWPELPYNARLADLIFIPLAVIILMLPTAKWTWRAVDWAVAGYLLGAVPSIVFSSDWQHSAGELGRELYLVAIYVIVAIAARHGLSRLIGEGLAIGGATLSIVGLAVLGIQRISGAQWPLFGEVMQLPYLGATLRLRALTATPAMFACLLTAAAPLAIALCRERRRRWCTAAIAMAIAGVFTFSHVMAGFAVAVVIVTWPWLAPWPRRLAVAAAVVMTLAFNFAAIASITSFSYGASSYVDATQYQYAIDQQELRIGDAAVTYNMMSYARIKQVAWRAFVAHPIAGVGLDRFHEETRRAYAEGRLTSTYQEIDPHSTLLGRLAECGIFGGLTLVLLWTAWAAMARDVARSETEAMLGCAAGAAIAGLVVASVNADIMNFRFLWVIAGMLRGVREMLPAAALQTHPRP